MPASDPEPPQPDAYLQDCNLGFTPRWEFHPDLEKMRTAIQTIFHTENVQVKHFAEGCFNKLYEVHVDDQAPLLLRIALPVDPQKKTLSEVATLQWAATITDIPIPKVIHFDASRDSLVSYEWILMSKLAGSRLEDTWHHLGLLQKTDTVRQIASFIASLFRVKFSSIGNIYPPVCASDLPRPGPMVSTCFFYGPINKSDINRGPFRNSREWFTARLEATKRDATATMAKWCGKGNLNSDVMKEIDDAARTFDIAERLRRLISRVFPFETEAETTVLYHDDLHGNNILVNETGTITGIVDWECVSVVPLWKACSMPQFLFEQPRWNEPDRTRYRHDASGNVYELYYRHLHQYETTALRDVFLHEMGRLEPQWMEVYERTKLRRDFDFAVQFCDDLAVLKYIVKWADAAEAGGDIPMMWDLVWADTLKWH
ncbi:altered inheritance of mitochondria 9 mitochondrial [Fusarium beomiforme]|uniref:Altered inheritance of mitochondria 9 mitochondrial n=1 Tax=Fusarium beomiforme TaxID=44412 RepID=A0A9P5DXN4_9HYPO|nr:altered inheritance of mitochondria 9 mitochondrial [Fusarium beomiforme]